MTKLITWLKTWAAKNLQVEKSKLTAEVAVFEKLIGTTVTLQKKHIDTYIKAHARLAEIETLLEHLS